MVQVLEDTREKMKVKLTELNKERKFKVRKRRQKRHSKTCNVILQIAKEKTIDTINATENPLPKFSANTEQMGSGKKGKCILNLA